MRAWLLLLAVLATFQPIVQVASTEDNISSRFIAAISPTSSTQTDSAAAVAAAATTTLTKHIAVTALSKPVNAPTSPTSATTTSALASPFIYVNTNSDSVSDSKSNNNISNNNNKRSSETKHNNNIIIEIKNFEEIEGNEVREIVEPQRELAHKQSTTDLVSARVSEQAMTISSPAHTSPVPSDAEAQPHTTDHKQEQQQHHQHHHTTSTTTATTSSQSVRHEEEQSAVDTSPRDSAPVDSDDVADDEQPATHSSKEADIEKVAPDPSILVEIEKSLLSVFNMATRPPKIDRSKIVIPEVMKKLYEQITGHDLDSVNIPKPGLLTKSANTVRSFTHQDSKIDDRFPHHHRFRLYFNIKSIPAEEKLKAAELQLTRDAISHAALHPRLANRTRYQVLVYDITRVGVKGKREPSYLLLDNKTIRLNSTDTVSLDVHPAVNRWLASPTRNFGLLVEVRTSRSLKPAPQHHVRLRRSADEPHEHWQHKQPLLLTYTDDGQYKSRSIRDVSKRTKRARRPHRRKNHEEICRRHALYVDFSDVGWSDWIVAPPGYDAYYCHGKCPFPLAEHLNSTNHAVVQTLVNNLDPGKAPKACCVPTQLEGISMLYLNDQSTVVVKNYQDMTVVGCGCR